MQNVVSFINFPQLFLYFYPYLITIHQCSQRLCRLYLNNVGDICGTCYSLHSFSLCCVISSIKSLACIDLLQENVVVVAIIPGPSEPQGQSLNHYLQPIIDQLDSLWKSGFKHKLPQETVERHFHGALLCCACDIPAARKLCGFKSHSARMGCSKCMKEFPTGKEVLTY